MKLIPSSLPLLNKEWDYLERYDIYMPDDSKKTEVPSIYGREPYPGDGRDYSDVAKERVRTINIPRGVGVESLAQAEIYLYDHYRFARLLDKKVCKGGNLFSFKVERDAQEK